MSSSAARFQGDMPDIEESYRSKTRATRTQRPPPLPPPPSPRREIVIDWIGRARDEENRSRHDRNG